MKLCLIACPAGHMTELLALMPASQEHERFIVTHDSLRTEYFRQLAAVYTIPDVGLNVWRFGLTFLRAFRLLWRERPDVIISTGTQLAIPFFVVGRALGVTTVFIESLSRIRSTSKTGRLIYPFASYFYVQWLSMTELYGPKAAYEGGLF
jgi:beta-1,4-N-acetylglucosaminyltransferase